MCSCGEPANHLTRSEISYSRPLTIEAPSAKVVSTWLLMCSVAPLATALVRGAFEYQGQKCSAASRAYVPESLWPALRGALEEQLSQVKMGSPLDFRNFVCAVIDSASFNNISSYVEEAKSSDDYEVVAGGGCDDSTGYFIEPTVVRAEDPAGRLMKEEIFGPLLTLFVYPDGELEKALELCDTTSPYALTGAIFAEDRKAILEMSSRLRHAARSGCRSHGPPRLLSGREHLRAGKPGFECLSETGNQSGENPL